MAFVSPEASRAKGRREGGAHRLRAGAGRADGTTLLKLLTLRDG